MAVQQAVDIGIDHEQSGLPNTASTQEPLKETTGHFLEGRHACQCQGKLGYEPRTGGHLSTPI